MDAEIVEFTRQALAKGVERAQIAEALHQAGWRQADITAALASFADLKFAVPVPRPKPYLSAGEVFLYLVMFTALYDSAYSLAAIAFEFIDRAFPDAIDTRQWRDLNVFIRRDVSSLLVTFPLFLFTFRLTNKAIAADPTRRGSRPRKWLTYITLFIAAMALVCDVTTLVYRLLGGEVTARFLLKAATVAAIGGGVFTYFLGDMRKEDAP